MKKTMYTLIPLLLLLFNITASAEGVPPERNPEDTVTIQIGKNKKIVIWVKDKKELESLQTYDINKMIDEIGKTVDSLNNPNQVLIITDENGSNYKIEIPEDSIRQDWYKKEDSSAHCKKGLFRSGIHFNRSSKDENPFGTRHEMEFDLGMNNYLNAANELPGAGNEQYAVRPWGSWFVGINSNFNSRIAGPLALQWGAGISWYNFKFEDKRTRIEKTADGLVFNQTDSDIYAIKSKLTASYLNVNLVPMLDFRYKSTKETGSDGQKRRVKTYNEDAFRIGLGAYAGYRIGSHTKYKFDDGDTRKEKDNDPYFLENLRYGIRFQLGIKSVDIFANYDLNRLFRADKGPELQAISFGITI